MLPKCNKVTAFQVLITGSCESAIEMSLEKTNPTAAQHPVLGQTLDRLVQKVHRATCSQLQTLLQGRNEATKQHFGKPEALLEVTCDSLAFPKTIPFSLGAAQKLWGPTAACSPLLPALALPLLLTFTPIGFMFPLPCGKAFKLIQPSSRVYPGSTHWDFPSFLLYSQGKKKAAGGMRHLGARGAAVRSFPELGFYCRRCIPWEGGCVCVGAFPHSGQLLFNGGLHAGQTPEEILPFPVPIQEQQQQLTWQALVWSR